MRAGLDYSIELLSKPYTGEALARKIRYVLGNRRVAPSSARHSQRRAVSHILVIDDDHELCLMVREILRAEAYKVLVAYDGEQGI